MLNTAEIHVFETSNPKRNSDFIRTIWGGHTDIITYSVIKQDQTQENKNKVKFK
jgi:hypothetical protein